jgi:hypothetical protein
MLLDRSFACRAAEAAPRTRSCAGS